MPRERNRILEFRILVLRDSQAFGEFYQLSKIDLFRFVLARVGSEDVAEDITSEVFLKICQYIFEERRTVTHLRGLLYSIARTSIIDYFRRVLRREAPLAPDDPLFLKLVDHQPSLGEAAEQRMNFQHLWEQLRKLKREYGEALTLRFIDDLTIPEIAVVLGKSNGSVRVLIHRAVRALEKQVEEDGDQPSQVRK